MQSYHRPRRIQYALGLCFVAFGGLVNAQGPVQNIPQCIPGTVPVLLEEPCAFLHLVMSTCAGDGFALLDVTSEPLGVYAGPTANTTALEKCQCTDVGYNLYSACAACQVGDDNTHWLSRERWFSGCIANSDETQIAVSPPKMTSSNFDPWIIQKYIPTFSLGQALAISTGGIIPAAITATSGTETFSVLASGASANPTNTSPNASNTIAVSSASLAPNSPNTTPIIIGAVVGAVGLLALLALLFFCIRRRQRQRTAPSAEFMKYSQVNAGSAREPLRANSRANTVEEEMHMHQAQAGGYQGGAGAMGAMGSGYKRHSAIRLDSVGSGEEMGDIEMTEGGVNPPPFTPGLFKDPIFEKGVALNLAAAAGTGSGGPYGGGSPVTYSPATPSTQAHVATQYSERHGLIHGRQETL